MNPLDAKLILDALDKLFAEQDARWDRRFADLDAAWDRRLAPPTSARAMGMQRDDATALGAGTLVQYGAALAVTADNWGGFFEHHDAAERIHSNARPSAVPCDAPMVADNWGGLFEEPAGVMEERDNRLLLDAGDLNERDLNLSAIDPIGPVLSGNADEAASTDQWFVDVLNGPALHHADADELFGLHAAPVEPSPDQAVARTKSNAADTPRCHAAVLAKASPALFAPGAPKPSLKYQLPWDDLDSLTDGDDDIYCGLPPTRAPLRSLMPSSMGAATNAADPMWLNPPEPPDSTLHSLAPPPPHISARAPTSTSVLHWHSDESTATINFVRPAPAPSASLRVSSASPPVPSIPPPKASPTAAPAPLSVVLNTSPVEALACFTCFETTRDLAIAMGACYGSSALALLHAPPPTLGADEVTSIDSHVAAPAGLNNHAAASNVTIATPTKCSLFCRNGFTSMLATAQSNYSPAWVSDKVDNSFERSVPASTIVSTQGKLDQMLQRYISNLTPSYSSDVALSCSASVICDIEKVFEGLFSQSLVQLTPIWPPPVGPCRSAVPRFQLPSPIWQYQIRSAVCLGLLLDGQLMSYSLISSVSPQFFNYPSQYTSTYSSPAIQSCSVFEIHGVPKVSIGWFAQNPVHLILLGACVQLQPQPWPPPSQVQVFTDQNMNILVVGSLLEAESVGVWTKPPWPPPQGNGIWFHLSVSFVLRCSLHQSTVPLFLCESCQVCWQFWLELLPGVGQIDELNNREAILHWLQPKCLILSIKYELSWESCPYLLELLEYDTLQIACACFVFDRGKSEKDEVQLDILVQWASLQVDISNLLLAFHPWALQVELKPGPDCLRHQVNQGMTRFCSLAAQIFFECIFLVGTLKDLLFLKCTCLVATEMAVTWRLFRVYTTLDTSPTNSVLVVMLLHVSLPNQCCFHMQLMACMASNIIQVVRQRSLSAHKFCISELDLQVLCDPSALHFNLQVPVHWLVGLLQILPLAAGSVAVAGLLPHLR